MTSSFRLKGLLLGQQNNCTKTQTSVPLFSAAYLTLDVCLFIVCTLLKIPIPSNQGKHQKGEKQKHKITE